jgi:hypothetical protein
MLGQLNGSLLALYFQLSEPELVCQASTKQWPFINARAPEN